MVGSTLTLLNNTATAGYFPASEDLSPEAFAYDPAAGRVFGQGLGWNVSVINDSTNTVVGNVQVPNATSGGLAFDPVRNELFVSVSFCSFLYFGYCLGTAGSIFVFNGSTLDYVGNISIPGPNGFVSSLTLDPGRGALYATLRLNDSVAVIDLGLGAVSKFVSVGSNPSSAVYDPVQGSIFVLNRGSNNVSVINDSSNAVVATIPVGIQPAHGLFDPSTGQVLVANNGSGNVSVLDPVGNVVNESLTVGDEPRAIALDPDLHELFVSDYGSWNLSVLNATSYAPLASVDLEGPSGLLYDAGQKTLYVSQPDLGNVSVVSPALNAVVDSMALARGPDAVAYDPAKNELFVADLYQNQVDVVNLTTYRVVATVPTGSEPWDLVYDGAKGEVFVSCNLDTNLTVINDTSDTVVTNITVAPTLNLTYGMTGIAYDPAQGEILLANGTADPGNLVLINDTTDRIVATVPVGSAPFAVAYDPAKDEAFVANSNSSNLTVVNLQTDRVVANLLLDQGLGYPDGVTYDPLRGQMFVADGAGVNVSVVSDTTNHLVGRINVSGPSLYMAFDANDRRLFVTNPFSSSLSIASDVTDRRVQNLTVGDTPTDAVFVPALGSVYVTDQYQGTVVQVLPANVVFRETGLANNSTWSVRINSPNWTEENTTNRSGSVEFALTPGPFSFEVEPPAGYGLSRVTGSNGPSYSNGTASGPTTLVLHFGPLENLTFYEVGLPNGSTWTVTISSGYSSGGLPGSLTRSTNATAITFVVVKGPWRYVVTGPAGYAPHPSHGILSVMARPKSKVEGFTLL